MEERSFDAWVRGVATRGLSRRGGLRLAIGGGVAALVGQIVVPDAAACRKDGRDCSRPGQCCSGICKGKRGKETCRRAKQAFGCTTRQDTCQTFAECPRREGSCFQLDSGEAYCAGRAACSDCRRGSECPLIVGAGRPQCITNCQDCQNQGGSACVYPNIV